MLIERLQVEKTTSHRSVRGWGRVIAVLYETHWKELLQPSWERQMDLQHSQQHILHYWAGTPLQHQQANRLYRRMRVGAAQREISQDEGARFLSPGYSLVKHQEWTRRFSTTVLPVGTHVRYKPGDHHLWLGKMSATPRRLLNTSFASWTTPDQ